MTQLTFPILPARPALTKSWLTKRVRAAVAISRAGGHNSRTDPRPAPEQPPVRASLTIGDVLAPLPRRVTPAIEGSDFVGMLPGQPGEEVHASLVQTLVRTGIWCITFGRFALGTVGDILRRRNIYCTRSCFVIFCTGQWSWIVGHRLRRDIDLSRRRR
jgi:hypothetical protein